MKTLKAFLISTSLLFCLYSCKKDGITNSGSIVGKWNIVSDSAYTGAGTSNHPVDYSGQPGDYFDFTSNGIIYTKEGTVLDTLSYKLVSNTSVIIGAFSITLNGVAQTSRITNLTSHSLVIQAPTLLTPGGIFSRKVSLSR